MPNNLLNGMNYTTITAALEARGDGDKFPIEVLFARLKLVVNTCTPFWSVDDICSAVCLAFHTTTAHDLKDNEVFRVASMIRSMWRQYPVNVNRQSRHDVLKHFLSGDHWHVEELSLELPTSHRLPATPGTNVDVIDVDAVDADVHHKETLPMAYMPLLAVHTTAQPTLPCKRRHVTDSSISTTPSLLAQTSIPTSPPRKRQHVTNDLQPGKLHVAQDESTREHPSLVSSSARPTTSVPIVSSKVTETRLENLLRYARISIRLLRHLSLRDVHHLRLAGVSFGCNLTNRILQKCMQRRVRALQTAINGMLAQDFVPSFLSMVKMDKSPGTMNWKKLLSLSLAEAQKLPVRVRGKMWPPAPSDLAKYGGTNWLFVRLAATQFLRLIAVEFPSLRRMRLYNGKPPFRQDIPMELSLCTQLRKLRLHGFNEMTKFPESVLKMRELETLQLVFFSSLSSLPNDIGVKMKKLKCIVLRGCEKLNEIPSSLMDTLERNFIRSEQLHGVVVRMMPQFTEGYWKRMVNGKFHPKLMRHVKEDGAHYGSGGIP